MPRSAERARGARPDRRDGGAGQRARVEAGALSHRLEEQADAVGAGQADQLVVADRAGDRARTSSLSIRGSIRIAGSSTTSAPRSRRVAARPLAWARARVTTTRRPCSGPALEPGELLAARGDRADDDQRRRLDLLALDRLGDRPQRRRRRCAGRARCRVRSPRPARSGSRPAGDQRRRVLAPAV